MFPPSYTAIAAAFTERQKHILKHALPMIRAIFTPHYRLRIYRQHFTDFIYATLLKSFIDNKMPILHLVSQKLNNFLFVNQIAHFFPPTPLDVSPLAHPLNPSSHRN
jgi:hypothetical protein